MDFEDCYKHNCKGCWNDECKFHQPTEDEEIAKLIEERDKQDDGTRYTSEDVTILRKILKNVKNKLKGEIL